MKPSNIRFHNVLVQYVGPLAMALAIGSLAGLGAVVFRAMIAGGQDLFWPEGGDFVGRVQQAEWWWRLLVPAAVGFAVGPVTTFWAKEVRGPGVPEVMEALALRGGRIRHRVTVIKSCVTAALISAGASVGREGPVVQIGSSIGSSLTQLLRLPTHSRRLAVACGAAAGIAATFQAPMAGTLFAVEVLLFDLEVASLSNVVIAAVTGTMVAKRFWGDEQVFSVPAFFLGHPAELLLYAALGLLAGGVSLGLMGLVFGLPRLWARCRVPEWLTPGVGGLLLGILGLAVPWGLGVGYESIEAALSGNISLSFAVVLLMAKLACTGLSIGSGMSGGVFAPSLFLGAACGSVVGLCGHWLWPAAGVVPAHYALVGMGAVVSGTTLAPITAILTIFELTYSYQVILPLMVACIASLTVVRLLHGYSAYETKLLQKGVHIVKGREVNILRGMTVRDYMKEDLQILHTDTPFSDVIVLMEMSVFPHFMVLDDDGRLQGVLTLRDMRSFLAHPDRIRDDVTAGSLMTGDVVTIEETANMETALRTLARHNFSFLPVVRSGEPGRVLGYVRKTDILFAYDEFVLKRQILPPSRWVCPLPGKKGD